MPRPQPGRNLAAACTPTAGGGLHVPACPPPQVLGRRAARVVGAGPEQVWRLLCNGLVVFDGTGVLLPGGQAIEPGRCTRRPAPPVADAAAVWPVAGSVPGSRRHAARLDGGRVRARAITHRHASQEGMCGNAW
jgi:hypothetical protein